MISTPARKMIATDAGRDPGIWNALANELGLLGAAFDEEHGGLGGGALENGLLMEEFGKVIAIEPYLQTVVIGGGALKAVGGAQAAAISRHHLWRNHHRLRLCRTAGPL
jgi:alkylation response protein AidB-like acyl-CoA dehydrogenase